MNPLAMKWKGGELIAPIKNAAFPESNWIIKRRNNLVLGLLSMTDLILWRKQRSNVTTPHHTAAFIPVLLFSGEFAKYFGFVQTSDSFPENVCVWNGRRNDYSRNDLKSRYRYDWQ